MDQVVDNQTSDRLYEVLEDRAEDLSYGTDNLDSIDLVFKYSGVHLDHLRAFHAFNLHLDSLNVFRSVFLIILFHFFFCRVYNFEVEVSLRVTEEAFHQSRQEWLKISFQASGELSHHVLDSQNLRVSIFQ